jgi:hypothetical protein
VLFFNLYFCKGLGLGLWFKIVVFSYGFRVFDFIFIL